MAEGQPAADQAPRVQVLAQYIRDLSFENVAMQKGIKIETAPNIVVKVGLDAQKRADDVYEVINKVNVEAKSGDQTVFIIEIEYAGMFRVQNVPAEQLHPFLMIECPRMIFPYLRRVVGDVSRDGGYPQMDLDNIDYRALYLKEIERRTAATEAAPEVPVN